MKHEILIYNQTKQKVPKMLIKETILKSFQFLKLKQPAELAVLVVSSSEIKRLNKVWRNKNYIPDELSFGLNSRQKVKFAKRKNNVLELGEIVINSSKISHRNKLAEILVHSLLHLFGKHHENSRAEAEKMERLEKKVLKYLKI